MVVIQSNELIVQIKKAGAEICSVKDNAGLEYMWQANPSVWPRHAPVLFPIVGKLANDSFTYQGSTYSLGQHGFARDQDFHVVEKKKSSCVFELRSTADTKLKFPFDFVLRISYSVNGRMLNTSYEVVNPGPASLLFAIGAHPGFRCPLVKGETYEDYYLEFSEKHPEISLLQNGLRNGTKKRLKLDNGKLKLNASLFDNDALVFEDGQIDKVSLHSVKSSHGITLHCEGWPFFGVWSKKGNTDFICLEPWYGIAGSVNENGRLEEKKGLIMLQAQEHFTCNFDLEFH